VTKVEGTSQDNGAEMSQAGEKAVILMERSDRRISYFPALEVHLDKGTKNETLNKNTSG